MKEADTGPARSTRIIVESSARRCRPLSSVRCGGYCCAPSCWFRCAAPSCKASGAQTILKCSMHLAAVEPTSTSLGPTLELRLLHRLCFLACAVSLSARLSRSRAPGIVCTASSRLKTRRLPHPSTRPPGPSCRCHCVSTRVGSWQIAGTAAAVTRVRFASTAAQRLASCACSHPPSRRVACCASLARALMAALTARQLLRPRSIEEVRRPP